MEILERLSEKFAEDFDAMNLTNVAWTPKISGESSIAQPLNPKPQPLNLEP